MKDHFVVINAQAGRGLHNRKLLPNLKQATEHAESILRNHCDPRSGTVMFVVKIERVVRFEPHPIEILRPTQADLEDYFNA